LTSSCSSTRTTCGERWLPHLETPIDIFVTEPFAFDQEIEHLRLRLAK
jgi:hypothetical protein